jgi:hypothetical protein
MRITMRSRETEMTALAPKPPVVPVAVAPRRSPLRRFAIAIAWLDAACAAMAVIVGRDGSPAWRLARVLIVVAGTLLAVMLWRGGDARRRATVALVVRYIRHPELLVLGLQMLVRIREETPNLHIMNSLGADAVGSRRAARL